jgi:hypothetical protein
MLFRFIFFLAALKKQVLLYHKDTISGVDSCIFVFVCICVTSSTFQHIINIQNNQTDMKQFRLFLTGVLVLLLTSGVNAQVKSGAQPQSKPDYFAGKWNILVKGTPGGDSKMLLTFERKDTVLTATIKDSTGTEAGSVNKVMENEQSVTVYFTAQGYDVDLVLEKKDDDHMTGNLMGGMFEAEGDRIKEGQEGKAK